MNAAKGLYAQERGILLVNWYGVVGAVFRPHPVVIPGEGLPPRDAVSEQRARGPARHAADRNGNPTAEYRGDEAIAELHLQVGAIEWLP